jgi:lactam utilization protein B
VLEAVAHRLQSPDRRVQLVGLGRERAAVDRRLALRREHRADLVEREAGRLAERDQRQLVQHAGLEAAAQALSAHRRDQPLALVEAQRRRRHARAPGHFGNVHDARAPLT